MFISRHFGKCCSFHLPGKWIWDLQGYFYIDVGVVGVGRLTICMVTLPYTADGNWNLENSSVLLAAQPWASDPSHGFRNVWELVHVPLRFFPHKIGHIQNSFPQMTFFHEESDFECIGDAWRHINITPLTWHLKTSLICLLLTTVPLRTRSAQSTLSDRRPTRNKYVYTPLRPHDPLRSSLVKKICDNLNIIASVPRAGHTW
jgi:hypothetical protein